jgi:two-component system, OmpR family, sensor histidine kinase AdeS
VLEHISQQVWRKIRRYRWPLTRQLALGFAALMIINGLLISAAIEVWSDYLIQEAIRAMSPGAQQTWANLQTSSYTPTAQEMQIFTREFEPIQTQLSDDIDAALLLLIAVAGVITMAFGYLMLGRLGRGFGNVAVAAQRITKGDLTARALPASFRSREEDQLTNDFNTMAAALRRAERELAESTASIAHELRTPLTILRGRLHGIADGVFELEPREVQGLIYQVEGLGRLVDDLQTVSLAHSERLVVAREHTDLADEVKRVLTLMEPDLKNAGLHVVVDFEPAPLLADGARLRQVVTAVLANACRYAALSGDLRIVTRTTCDAATLEIIDNGPGVVEGGEDQAFDRFWRGEKSRNRDTGGSGLGLSVVRAIVEAHGGTATLRNHAGGGAAFSMHLPSSGI